jgi:hypothetical protein
MVPGGITEVVWHFAGYLKIFDDIARDRLAYDPSAYHAQQDDYVIPRSFYEYKPDLDEPDSRATPMPATLPFEELRDAHLRPIKLLAEHELEPDFDHGLRIPRLPMSLPSAGGGGGTDFNITIRYGNDSGQTQIDIHQINVMSDDDLLVIKPDSAPLPVEISLIAVHSEDALYRMADEANGQIPEDWWISKNSTDATEFLKTHDESLANGDGSPNPHSVEPGYYLNGVLQDPAPEPPDHATPPAEEEEKPDFGDGLGQWAMLGGNDSLNAALIVDLTESGRTMIVMGDYFKTNAILQTNSLMDSGNVSMAGGHEIPALPGANVTDNTADFVQHAGIYEGLPAGFAGPNWHIDVVEGDYYDIHTVVQFNYLSDNDVIVQQSSDSHYEIYGGQNEQGNYAEAFTGDIHYDLIIVAGAYHGMNVIFQNNVLLNQDQIKMIVDGIEAAQSAVTGQNELNNIATIENYGDDNFKPMDDNVNGIVTAVGNGVTALDPIYGTYIDGSGGTFDVLYVKGDYYDLNAIWQTNVTSDVDVLAQLMDAPSPAAAAYYGEGEATQSANTGQNLLTNDAAIVDVGATNTYVNGQVYGDTILVQANLVPTDPDHALSQDTNALVPELIAFVNDVQDETPAIQPVVTPHVHDDPIASVTH